MIHQDIPVSMNSGIFSHIRRSFWRSAYATVHQQTQILRRAARIKRLDGFSGQIIHSVNFNPRRKRGSAHSFPSYEDGGSSNILFGHDIHLDALLFRIRVWWSGYCTDGMTQNLITYTDRSHQVSWYLKLSWLSLHYVGYSQITMLHCSSSSIY
jgi:hypothetical protein